MEQVAGIPPAALNALVRRLNVAASLNLPSSEQKIHLAEFVRVHVLVSHADGEEGDGGDVIEKRGRVLDLFGYLLEEAIAPPDILQEVFQDCFPEPNGAAKHQQHGKKKRPATDPTSAGAKKQKQAPNGTKVNPVGKLDSESWDQKFGLLLEFCRENGHCRVPHRFVVKSVKLGNWVSDQRRFYKNFMQGKDTHAYITLDRIGKLNSIGFEWSVGPAKSSVNDAPALEDGKIFDVQKDGPPVHSMSCATALPPLTFRIPSVPEHAR